MVQKGVSWLQKGFAPFYAVNNYAKQNSGFSQKSIESPSQQDHAENRIVGSLKRASKPHPSKTMRNKSNLLHSYIWRNKAVCYGWRSTLNHCSTWYFIDALTALVFFTIRYHDPQLCAAVRRKYQLCYRMASKHMLKCKTIFKNVQLRCWKSKVNTRYINKIMAKQQ